MTAIEERYRTLCERLADELAVEAQVCEEHPTLLDSDRQLIGVLREKGREWQQQIQRLDAAYPESAAQEGNNDSLFASTATAD
jgi:hypothetical protein